MKTRPGLHGKYSFYLAMGILNVGAMALLFSYNSPSRSNRAVNIATVQKEVKEEAVIGKPVRMSIPSLSLELPVDEGHYNPADASWTLSGYHAQFAMPTMLANDQTGNTLIYGHNNKHVFGPLKRLQPGAIVEIKTDNKHLFYYRYHSSKTIAPDDVSIFEYDGLPILTLQTCTGNWHELRTMSTFTLERVEKYNPNAEQERIESQKFKEALDNLANPAYPVSGIVTSQTQ